MMDATARREHVFLALDSDLNSRGRAAFVDATAHNLASSLWQNDPEMSAEIEHADEIRSDVQAWLDLHPDLETDPDYYSLKYAVERLQGAGLTARLAAFKITGRLMLIADLTRHDFNSGQPMEVFSIGVFDGMVLRESLNDRLTRYHRRKKTGLSLQLEVTSHRELAKC
jgi:hypothetical protein